MSFTKLCLISAVVLIISKQCIGIQSCSEFLKFSRIKEDFIADFRLKLPYSEENRMIVIRASISLERSDDVNVFIGFKDTSYERLEYYKKNDYLNMFVISSGASQNYKIDKLEVESNTFCLVVCSGDSKYSVTRNATLNWYPHGKIGVNTPGCASKIHTNYEEPPITLTELYKFSYTDCGQSRQSDFVKLAYHGFEIKRKEWPWLVAIENVSRRSRRFICGGTIITNKAVVSAAHCFVSNGVKTATEEIVLHFGKHNLSIDNEAGNFKSNVKKLLVHPEYDEQTYDADIALLQVTDIIMFSDYIQPACLWNGPPLIDDVAGSLGKVVGWGKTETGQFSQVPLSIKGTIATEHSCSTSDSPLAAIASKRTFCAGFKNGTGPCEGDSGGGLLLLQDDRWFIRGIVSVGLVKRQTSMCDLEDYVIYTDVAKFTLWISMSLLQFY